MTKRKKRNLSRQLYKHGAKSQRRKKLSLWWRRSWVFTITFTETYPAGTQDLAQKWMSFIDNERPVVATTE